MAAYGNFVTPRASRLPVAARAIEPISTPGTVVGRPSWDLGGMNQLMGPYSHVPVTANFPLYERMQEAVPIIDASIMRITELIGTPCVEAEDDTKDEINEWLSNLRVNQVQTGLNSFLPTFVGNMLTYGRSHAEIVLNNRRDDIDSLWNLHPGTIAFSLAEDGYTTNTVQLGRIQPLVFPSWKIMNAVNRVRGDDPNGTSLLWGMPLVAECYTAMVRSQQQLWTRFGTPTYVVTWEPPPDFQDTQGEKSRAILGDMRTQFSSAMQARASGNIKDVFLSGKVTVSVVGAAGEELEFSTSAQNILEALLGKTGLPTFLVALPGPTTERMSTVQSSVLGELVDQYQCVLTPPLTRMIRLRQQLKGGDTEFKLGWEGATLQDKMQDAQADLAEEEAKAAAWENNIKLRKQGMLTPVEWLKRSRPDLAEMDEEELKKRLPEFDPNPPEPELPPGGGMPFGQGNGANPGRNQGPNNNRAPQAQGKSLSYHDDWTPATNGNGRHG